MAKYHYVVDLDERGYYYAHVTDAETEQKIIFEVSNEYSDTDEDGYDFTYFGEIGMVQDGFMKHGEDMNGLWRYLVDMGTLTINDELVYRG